MQGKGVTACRAAWVLLLLLHCVQERHFVQGMHHIFSGTGRNMQAGACSVCFQGLGNARQQSLCEGPSVHHAATAGWQDLASHKLNV
jgi:hypothetical protein